MNDLIQRNQWLEGLKPEDEVCYSGGWSHRFTMDRVERLTDTLIVLKSGHKIRRRDGHETGSGYSRIYIHPVTADVLATNEENDLRVKARGIDWHKLPVETLRKVLSVYDEAQDATTSEPAVLPSK